MTDFSQTIRTVPLVCGMVGLVGLVGLVRQVGRSGVGGEVGKWGWVDGKASLSGRGSEAYRELVEFSLWIIC